MAERAVERPDPSWVIAEAVAEAHRREANGPEVGHYALVALEEAGWLVTPAPSSGDKNYA